MSKEIELLKKCGDIFAEMDGLEWDDESGWQYSGYEVIAIEVNGFLDDLKKEVQKCPGCGKKHAFGFESNGVCPVCDFEIPF